MDRRKSGLPNYWVECNWCKTKIEIEDYPEFHNMGKCRNG